MFKKGEKYKSRNGDTYTFVATVPDAAMEEEELEDAW